MTYTIEKYLRKYKGNLIRSNDNYLYHRHSKQSNRIYVRCIRMWNKDPKLRCNGKASIYIRTDLISVTVGHNNDSEENFIEYRSVERNMKKIIEKPQRGGTKQVYNDCLCDASEVATKKYNHIA